MRAIRVCRKNGTRWSNGRTIVKRDGRVCSYPAITKPNRRPAGLSPVSARRGGPCDRRRFAPGRRASVPLPEGWAGARPPSVGNWPIVLTPLTVSLPGPQRRLVFEGQRAGVGEPGLQVAGGPNDRINTLAGTYTGRSGIPGLNRRVFGPRAHNAPEVQRHSLSHIRYRVSSKIDGPDRRANRRYLERIFGCLLCKRGAVFTSA